MAFALALIGALTWAPQSYGATYGSVSHIHSIKVFGDRVLLGTHEGLFEYQASNTMKRISSEDLDFMGLAPFGETIYSSGHPGAKSKLPNPIGLISSADSGKTWKKIATLPSEISSITMNAKIFVAVTSDAIFVSRDGGKSFKS